MALLICAAPAALLAVSTDPVGVAPGAGIRYATDAYPGFDHEKDILNPSRKEPSFFSWFFAPECDDAASQLKYCRELEAAGEWSKAASEYDALVKEWPAAPEAVKAQRALADIRWEREKDAEEAYREYRYLADFYSLDCDYEKVIDKMYELAGVMRIEGKTIVFFNFRNTIDVRRAYEGCVLRAPGAKWAPQAMLQIGELREEEERYSEAVKVYENLRNLHSGTPEAKQSLIKEAAVRMQIIREYEYNRERCRDTIDFLKMASASVDGADLELVESWLKEAHAQIESEAFRSAKFYDSRMRTRRSAINAYEKFLKDYPDGAHANEARLRLEALKSAKEVEK